MKVRSRAAGCSAQAPRDWSVSAGFEPRCTVHHFQQWNGMLGTKTRDVAGSKGSDSPPVFLFAQTLRTALN
jgi:hypothetical protein